MPILRGINAETVDLIATDPPFNKNKKFQATPDTLASGASFQDRWRWEDDVDGEWIDKLEDDFPNVYHVVQGSRKSYGDDMGAFLCFMAVRLLEMRRILKGTGSIYLHCDPTASHYLKQLMDAIFGRKNFQNEFIWYYSGGGASKNRWARKHDVILFYTKSGKWTFNADDVRVPYKWTKGQKRADGSGRDYEKGKLADDVYELHGVMPWAKERTGYPTQKPVSLYERIILASSNEWDVVLDPFCGCATTLIAAENLNRNWIGIDLWKDAHKTVWDRLREECWLEDPEGKRKGLPILKPEGVINYQTTPPENTDEEKEAVPDLKNKIRHAEPKEERKSRNQIFAELVEQNRTDKGIKCVGCNRFFDDKLYLQLDHNIPRSQGGINHISNRMLLCGPCNLIKGIKYTLRGLQAENRKRERML